jgi:hypothetical protein
MRIATAGVRFLLLGCVAGLALASPAHALISGASSSNGGSTCSGGNNADGFCGSSTSVPVNNGSTLQSRYAWNINADTAVFSTRDTSGTAQHNVGFTATAPGGYRLDIATQRIGMLQRNDDAPNCDGQAHTSGISGSSNIALNSGTLSLSSPADIGNGGGDNQIPFNQSSSAFILRASNNVGQGHSLTFTWNGSVRSNSCEAAVRMGQQNGSTTDCGACEYPGIPTRTQNTDGHFVTVTFTSLCGNGAIDGSVGEQCDQGAANGTSTSCCTASCQFRAAGQQCRGSAGVCDPAEVCTGSIGTCPANAVSTSGTPCTTDGNPCTLDQCDGFNVTCQHPAGNPGAVCRNVAGECDVAETCDGVTQFCPFDQAKPANTPCTDEGNPCTADQCDGTSITCGHLPGNFGATCRTSAGVCDVAETCDGVNSSCPADLKSTAPCRPATDVCDAPESCDGVGDACPADGFTTGNLCRPPADVCDAPESCNGSGPACPIDGLALPTQICRPVAGSCDVAELCTGLAITCPADLSLPDSTPCSDGSSCTLGDVCQAGVCTGTPDLDGCLDDFNCYKAKTTPGTPKFAQIASVSLSDDFETATASVLKPKNLCTPADKNAEGTVDTATHLERYLIRQIAPLHVKQTNLLVTNQLGSLRLDTIKPSYLMVPTAKSVSGPTPPAPDSNTINVDHYKCYKVRVTAGTPKFVKNTAVSVADQFTSPAKTLLLKKPKNLCLPVDKNGEGIKNPTGHLLCYIVKPAIGAPAHVSQPQLFVNNQLGPELLKTIKEGEFCIPSTRSASPSGAFLDGELS